MEKVSDKNRMVSRVCLADEFRWGTMLGVLQDDADKLRSVLRVVYGEISCDLVTRKERLVADVDRVENDGVYQRLWELKCKLGGLILMFDGIDGVLSSVVVDMLRGGKSSFVSENV